MKRKIEKNYVNELWESINSNFEAFVDTGSQENLHQFRVYVKKLRAFIVLLDDALKQDKLARAFKPIKKIFKHAGKIREAYINLQMSSHYDLKNEEFVQLQVNEIEREVINFRLNAKKYQKILKQVYESIGEELQETRNDRINDFYHHQLTHIASTLEKIEFTEVLHDCRKQIKTLVYNRKIVGKALDGKLNFNAEYLDQLQEHIGNWHDTVVAIQLFSAPAFNGQPVIAKIKRQSTRLRKSINELSKDFFIRATFKESTKLS